ncbi:MAG: hypothetical protein MZW92_44910 [Comamonadaceae bacterium]|nr:hypothetical protein [Comamonadaceae bacterium]
MRDGSGVEACGVLTACDPRLADELQGTRDSRGAPLGRLRDGAPAGRRRRAAGPARRRAPRGVRGGPRLRLRLDGTGARPRAAGLHPPRAAVPGIQRRRATSTTMRPSLALRLQARAVAFELHEWWIEQTNRESPCGRRPR